MVNLKPTKCNICGGNVVYMSNAFIYGKEYGSGKCYYCTECGAYVGTHKPRPEESLGILANAEMRALKMQCHGLFDKAWKDKETLTGRQAARKNAYKRLASELGIPVKECHFGWFDKEMLEKAYGILMKWQRSDGVWF